jgi:hypothetical protein
MQTIEIHNESCQGNKSSMSDSAMRDDPDIKCRGASELRERTAVKVDACSSPTCRADDHAHECLLLGN